ncbi:MAG: hypothetical protein RMZ41_027920 [Nostoc sp. DedVER02]|uniref:hypothetical protein n=1 Tax=unclassified Nostoc TaxID=2593658 RepID=UPI002AD23F4C|nr:MULTISPECIES: hypothetical protein [unclassified Nostoc]MDZ7988075.1 hypothetical protein [Nostoc sp. DedVER02]MDZ8115503.1 hypothetical protein [Nostoc sp. DedVER01b]
MTIWIVTTGNSDVILKHDKNWGSLYSEVRYDLECTEFASLTQKDPYNKEAGYTLPARVLGLVYANKLDKYGSDLEFPLFDTYSQSFLDNNIKPERIIILLTDQSEIFNQDQILYEKCPYWQDTCTLRPLLEWYLKEKFDCQLEFLHLTPKNADKGIDNWNETLYLVEEAFCKLDFNPLKPVYISHQAGTPAISSAVQFVSLGRFPKVKFLVSNEYFDENYQQKSKSEAIESSNYRRGMQIQKAKQLIIGGLPGAALKILEDIERIDKTAIANLEKIVDFFNLHSPLTDSSQDFAIPQATQRIVDTLDLISFFFNQRNYLQGITLLAAAQETFLKVAILSQVAMINETVIVNGSAQKVSDLLEWIPRGLFLKQSLSYQSIDEKKLILQKLKFPVDRFRFNTDKDFDISNKNFALIAWLNNIDKSFVKWPLLLWYCDSYRNTEDDLRNQLMHNLCGVEDREVIDYLLGYKNHQYNDVMSAYINDVKQPFLNAINYFQLDYKREKLKKKLQEIADSLI